MPSQADDDPIKWSSTEPYDRVGASLRWSQLLGAASSIFFGFLLNIAVNPPSYFHFSDDMILLAALYAVTVATVMFIMPVIHHLIHYRQFDVENFLLKIKKYTLIGIFCIMVAMYLALGLSLDSKLPTEIAYGLASLPFIFIFLRFYRYAPTNLTKSFATEPYDRVGAGMRWSQILAAASSIFFGFLFNIAVNPPSYFHFSDDMILLAALYAVTVATVMFIMPVIHHSTHYRQFDIERFLLITKEYVIIGIICIMFTMYLGLGLALNSKLPIQIAYGSASLPFIFIFFRIFKNPRRKV
jgi:membrane protein YdbS with pleckstrin-like domain